MSEDSPRPDLPVSALQVVDDKRLEIPSAARRRLLRAGAIVPSVLTLSSGAALAAASGTSCLTNTSTTPPQRFSTTKDQWLRKPVFNGEMKTGPYSGQPAYCVSGDTSKSASCVDFQKGGGADGSVWVRSDGARFTAGAGQKVDNVENTPYYGLVYVDKDGQVMTLDPNGSPTLYAATYGCAVSTGLIVNSKLLG